MGVQGGGGTDGDLRGPLGAGGAFPMTQTWEAGLGLQGTPLHGSPCGLGIPNHST